MDWMESNYEALTEKDKSDFGQHCLDYDAWVSKINNKHMIDGAIDLCRIERGL